MADSAVQIDTLDDYWARQRWEDAYFGLHEHLPTQVRPDCFACSQTGHR